MTLTEHVQNIPGHQREGRSWSPVNHTDLLDWEAAIKRLLRDYSLFEECSPPDVPRAEFVKWCYDAWESESEKKA